MKLNLKVRIKNPVFWAHVIGAFFVPILAHTGLNWNQIDSWPMLFSLVSGAFASPALLVSIVISIWNFIVDPTTKGLSDSEQALTYSKPKE